LFRRVFVTQLETAFDAGTVRFFGSLIPLQGRRAFLEHLARGMPTGWCLRNGPSQ
jgi:hypothetical protein